MPKFRKKPLIVEAEQFLPEKLPWPAGVYSMTAPGSDAEPGWALGVYESVVEVTPGDWIIIDAKGVPYPCKPDIFEMTHLRLRHRLVVAQCPYVLPYIGDLDGTGFHNCVLRMFHDGEHEAIRGKKAPKDKWTTDCPTCERCLPEPGPRAPFHALFTDPEMGDVNVDFRVRCFSTDRDHRRDILELAEKRMKQSGASLEAYIDSKGTGTAILDWYANGPKPPKDRAGMLALYHPQVHKRFWPDIVRHAEMTAAALGRWVWLCEADGTHWFMLLLGPDPRGLEDGAKIPSRPGDQFITCIGPNGEDHFIGFS